MEGGNGRADVIVRSDMALRSIKAVASAWQVARTASSAVKKNIIIKASPSHDQRLWRSISTHQ